ncbi:MAG: hypothetical protein BroJett030_28920 [Alphaproteobacteria bacterium]|nr:MAG: hypothetical protein BroJett030_28920 [Alphaproteobacteria bacterium]
MAMHFGPVRLPPDRFPPFAAMACSSSLPTGPDPAARLGSVVGGALFSKAEERGSPARRIMLSPIRTGGKGSPPATFVAIAPARYLRLAQKRWMRAQASSSAAVEVA